MNFQEIMAKYSPAVICMALIVMILVGIVKIFTKMIAKKKNAASKLAKIASYLYLVFALVLAAGVVSGYHFIFKLEFDISVMATEFTCVFGCTQILYPVYRDFGGRFLFLKVLSLFKGKSKKADDIISIIEKVLPLTENQKHVLSEKLIDKK